MYDNIGGKLKGLATTICVIEVIAAVISGIALMASNEHLAVVGLLVMIIGSLFAWISSWLLYGFGELIEKTCEIAKNTYRGEKYTSDYERIKELKELRAKGYITEDEYNFAISEEQ